MLNNNRKFSRKYRLEKWFYEDSKQDAKRAIRIVCECVAGFMLFGSLFFIHALFH